jgi:TonB-dependent SusC/RagA subfamily outer membrane receptor
VVTSNSGDPGSYGTTITIRGIGTVNNNNPIYVVDGMLVDVSDQTNRANNINFLNPSDIASIEVLKDASAQAIYGSRGANGVTLITTKKGSEGAQKVTFSSSFGYESLIRINKLMNASEFKD